MHRELGKEGLRRGRRKLYAHKVAANQEMGTKMVVEAQTEIGAFVSQNSGGPLNVTKMLAAIDSNISDTREGAEVDERTYL
jgi:hypothetical protein